MCSLRPFPFAHGHLPGLCAAPQPHPYCVPGAAPPPHTPPSLCAPCPHCVRVQYGGSASYTLSLRADGREHGGGGVARCGWRRECVPIPWLAHAGGREERSPSGGGREREPERIGRGGSRVDPPASMAARGGGVARCWVGGVRTGERGSVVAWVEGTGRGEPEGRAGPVPRLASREWARG